MGLWREPREARERSVIPSIGVFARVAVEHRVWSAQFSVITVGHVHHTLTTPVDHWVVSEHSRLVAAVHGYE